MQSFKKIGVLGLGSFGSFVPRLWPSEVEILGHDSGDTRKKPGIRNVSFEEVLDVDALILAVPLFSYEQLLPQISQKLKPETLLIDICSVKVLPEQHITKYFSTHPNILMTHPLFGPQSAKHSTAGHQLIVTSQEGARAEEYLTYCSDVLELKVSKMTAEEHDKIMAQIHVLTFFVARGLGTMKLKDTPFETPSYSMIRDLVAFNASHSEELFETIQLGNPYGQAIRNEFIECLESVNKELGQTKSQAKNDNV